MSINAHKPYSLNEQKQKQRQKKQGKEKPPLVQRLRKEKKSTSFNSAEGELAADYIDRGTKRLFVKR